MLFQDETILREMPPLRAMWARIGEQAEVAITGNNARRVVFGTLNSATGTRVLWAERGNRAVDFCAFLRHLRRTYTRWNVVLLLDKASSHTAHASRREAERLRIELLWLPTACPELNPTELLWKDGKDDVSANRVYPSVDEQATAFVQHLLGMSNHEALQTAGVLSNDFWLST